MTPTIRLRDGADERLKREFGLATDSALAAHCRLNQGQYSRVRAGLSSPGPSFQAKILIAVQPLELDFYDLFEIVADEKTS